MWGKKQTLPKILAISQHAMQWWCWKSRHGQYALEWEAVARPQQRIRANKITSKLGLGLNFAVNVDFWVCNDDFNKKKWRQKRDFCCFSMTLKTVFFVFVQIQTLIFCKNRWYFCVYWVSQFERLSSEWSQLIVKAMFAWLRKLQFLKQWSLVRAHTGALGVNGLNHITPSVSVNYHVPEEFKREWWMVYQNVSLRVSQFW